MRLFLFVVYFIHSARGGAINVLYLEILPYDFLLDDENENTFFEREHLNN